MGKPNYVEPFYTVFAKIGLGD